MDVLERAKELLPRDVFLKIIGYFDIKTRIRFSLVQKLRVPDDVQQRLINVTRPQNIQGVGFVWLGPIMYYISRGQRYQYSKYKIYKYPSNVIETDVFHSFIKDGFLISNYLRYISTSTSTLPLVNKHIDSIIEIDRV